MQNETTELSTTNILSLFETTKTERQSFVENVIDKIVAEEVDMLKIHKQLKSLEDISSQLQDNKTYKEYLLNAAEKHGKKFQYQNAEFIIKEVGTKYDYSNCNDLELNDLMRQMDVLKAKIDKKQETLKHLPLSGMLTTDEKTGDTYKIYPPSKKSTTAVSVTLK